MSRQNMVIGFIVVLLAFIIIRNRGSQQQLAQQVDPQQVAENVAKETAQQVASQFQGAIQNAVAPVSPEKSQSPQIRDAREELSNLGYKAIVAPQGKVCGGDNSLSFGDVLAVPGKPDYYLVVRYKKGFDGNGVDGEHCSYIVFYIPPNSSVSPNINPLDCYTVFYDNLPPTPFTFGNGATLKVATFHPEVVVPNGYENVRDGAYCVNGNWEIPKG